MHRFAYPILAGAAALSLAAVPATVHAQDDSRAVAGGGIMAQGWAGKVDAGEARRNLTINDALLMQHGAMLHVKTGPAVTYWNPANTASGDYTVKATFNEARYMELNNHPHPYGIMIAGNDLGTDQQSFLYCAAYGNGRFIVRGFAGAETTFQLNGPRGEEHEAVNRAAGRLEPVTQEIAVSVRGGKVECAINGTVVASYDRSEVVGEGKLKSTDGVWGIRFAHNTEGTVAGLGVTR